VVAWVQRGGPGDVPAKGARATPTVIRARGDDDTASVVWRDPSGTIVGIVEFDTNGSLDAYLGGSTSIDDLVAADRANVVEGLSITASLPRPDGSSPVKTPQPPREAGPASNATETRADSTGGAGFLGNLVKILHGIFKKIRTGRTALFLVAKDAMKRSAAMQAQLKLLQRKARGLRNRVTGGGGGRAMADLAKAEQDIARLQAELAANQKLLSEANAMVRGEQRVASGVMREINQAMEGGGAARKSAGGRAWQTAWKLVGPRVNSLLQLLVGARGTTVLLSIARKLSNPWISRSLIGIGALLEGVNAYQTSKNQTTGGKVADAALSAGGGALVVANPIVALTDVFAPKGYKPSEVYRGGAGAVTAIGEGVITGDTRAMEGFHEASKRGEYGKVMQASSEAGDYWAEKGVVGGLKEFGSAVLDLF
jgi:hypothetical protein